jgi:hypothetical protein
MKHEEEYSLPYTFTLYCFKHFIIIWHIPPPSTSQHTFQFCYKDQIGMALLIVTRLHQPDYSPLSRAKIKKGTAICMEIMGRHNDTV